MAKLILVKADLGEFLAAVAGKYHGSGRILLVGETSHLWEDLRHGTSQFELVAEGAASDGTRLSTVCAEVGDALNVTLLSDSPADFVPLPDGFEDRVLVASGPPPELNDPKTGSDIGLAHFDPYSVAIRFIARGDEPDYHLVLTSLSAGWVVEAELDHMLADLLERFTLETIQQDPAEFRRKYKGLLQIWRAARPGLVHRFTAV